MFTIQSEFELMEKYLDLAEEAAASENTSENRAIVYGKYHAALTKSKKTENEVCVGYWLTIADVIKHSCLKLNPKLKFKK